MKQRKQSDLDYNDRNEKSNKQTYAPSKKWKILAGVTTGVAIGAIVAGTVLGVQAYYNQNQPTKPDSFITVNFNLDGGKFKWTIEYNKILVEKTSKFGSLPTPTKEGYSFKGYKNETGIVDPETVIGTAIGEVDQISLTAMWELIPPPPASNSVIFVHNYGISWEPKTYELSQNIKMNYNLLNSRKIDNFNSLFSIGDNHYSVSSADIDTSENTFTIPGELVTSTPVIMNIDTQDVNSYWVHFVSNDPQVTISGISTILLDGGTTLGAISKPSASKPQSTNIGWALEDDPTNVLPDTYAINSDITLVPVFEANPEFNINDENTQKALTEMYHDDGSFDINVKNISCSQNLAPYINKITVDVTSFDTVDYSFSYQFSNLTNNSFDLNFHFIPKELDENNPVTNYLKTASAINDFSNTPNAGKTMYVVFKCSEPDATRIGNAKSQVMYWRPFTTAAAPSWQKEGYHFAGWYKDEQNIKLAPGSPMYTYNTSGTSDQRIVYAMLAPDELDTFNMTFSILYNQENIFDSSMYTEEVEEYLPECHVKFKDGNELTNADTTITIKNGTLFKDIQDKPIPTKEGYSFIGWNKPDNFIVEEDVEIEPIFKQITQPISLDNCLSITAESDSEIILDTTKGYNFLKDPFNISYSINGEDWNNVPLETSAISIPAGSKLYIKGDNPTGVAYFPSYGTEDNILNAKITINSGDVTLGGDLMGLVNDGGNNGTITSVPSTYCFAKLFSECKGNITIPSGFFDLPGIKGYAFSNMFASCTGDIILSENLIDNAVLADHCFANTFKGCTKLTSLPSVLVTENTTLANYCFMDMFNSCAGLESLPATLLKPTTLANYCYTEMFNTCSGLLTIPSGFLPATTLSNSCYKDMFVNCTQLKTIENNFMPATKMAAYSCQEMFKNCKQLVTVAPLPNATLNSSCYASMFEGCEALVSLPQNMLPSETLKQNCYAAMFSGCKNLSSLPENLLPARTLIMGCYESMFFGCRKLIVEESGTTCFFDASDITISGSVASSVTDMFYGTGGSYTDDPVTGGKYYC